MYEQWIEQSPYHVYRESKPSSSLFLLDSTTAQGEGKYLGYKIFIPHYKFCPSIQYIFIQESIPLNENHSQDWYSESLTC